MTFVQSKYNFVFSRFLFHCCFQNELAIYKRDNGHCNVPKNYKDNPPLAIWCDTQRQSKKKGNLSDERVGRLNELGFEWEIRKIVDWDVRCVS